MASTGSPPPGPPPPAQPPGESVPYVAPAGEGRSRSWIAPVVIAVLGLLLVGVAVVAGRGSSGGESASGEIFLESAASLGRSPFTEPIDPEPATTTTTAVPPVVPARQPTSGVVPPPGSPPYGGSGDDRVCDREKLIGFLTANPDQARAWGGVLGVSVDQIPAYVRSLTPTVLLYDTRVTNHGYANGRATALQSVLQAGTAVLVDAQGNPVVRCRCGNPLAPPATVSRPVLVGTPWPGFDPTTVVSVNNGLTVTVVIPVATTTSTTPTSTAATSSSSTTGAVDTTRIAGLLAVVAECSGGAPVEVLDVQDDPVLANTVTARLLVNGETMLFTYDDVTGTVGEGDRASADFLRACGVGG